jgi:hypothetical protein
MSKPPQLLTLVTGTFLCKLLESASLLKAVLVMRGRHAALMLPADALRLMRGGSYVGRVASSGRLRQIDEIDGRLFPVIPAHWQNRAVIRFHPDQRDLPAPVKNRERAGLWDRMLQLDPPPRSWRKREVPCAD